MEVLYFEVKRVLSLYMVFKDLLNIHHKYKYNTLIYKIINEKNYNFVTIKQLAGFILYIS